MTFPDFIYFSMIFNDLIQYSMTFKAWNFDLLNSMTFQVFHDLYEPCATCWVCLEQYISTGSKPACRVY